MPKPAKATEPELIERLKDKATYPSYSSIAKSFGMFPAMTFKHRCNKLEIKYNIEPREVKVGPKTSEVWDNLIFEEKKETKPKTIKAVQYYKPKCKKRDCKYWSVFTSGMHYCDYLGMTGEPRQSDAG